MELTDKQLKYREYYAANKDDIRRRKLEAYYVKTYDEKGLARPQPTRRAAEKQNRLRLAEMEKENVALKQVIVMMKMIQMSTEQDDY